MSQEILRFSAKDVETTLADMAVYTKILDRLGSKDPLILGIVARRKLQIANQMRENDQDLSQVTIWTLCDPSEDRRVHYVLDLGSSSGRKELTASTHRIGNLLDYPLAWGNIPGIISDLTKEGMKHAV